MSRIAELGSVCGCMVVGLRVAGAGLGDCGGRCHKTRKQRDYAKRTEASYG